MSRRGWASIWAALLALAACGEARSLETTPAWQADLGMLTSLAYPPDTDDQLPVLFADGAAIMLSPTTIEGTVPSVAIDPAGMVSRTQSRLHVESQRWLVPQDVRARGARLALVTLDIMQGFTRRGQILVGVDQRGSVVWSRPSAWTGLANDDGSFWLAGAAMLERVAADGSSLIIVDVDALVGEGRYLYGISGRGNEILVYGYRADGPRSFLEFRDRGSGALTRSVEFDVRSAFPSGIAMTGDRLYAAYLHYEGSAANTYALDIEIRSTTDGGLVGEVTLPSFSALSGPLVLHPLPDGGLLVLHTDDGLDLVATHGDGSLRWRQSIEGIKDPIVATSHDGTRIGVVGTVEVAPTSIRLHALDVPSGTMLASADFTGTAERAGFELDAVETGWVLAHSRAGGLDRLRLAHDLDVQVNHRAEAGLFVELVSGSALVHDRLIVAREITTGAGRTIQMRAINPVDGTPLDDVVLQPLPISAGTRITELTLTRLADGIVLHAPVERPWGQGPCPSLVQTHVLMLEPDTLRERWRTSIYDSFPIYLRSHDGQTLYVMSTSRDPVTCAAVQSNVLSAWSPGNGQVRWSETTPLTRTYMRSWSGQVLTVVDFGSQLDRELVMRSAADGSVIWRSLVPNQEYPVISLNTPAGRVVTLEVPLQESSIALAARSLADGQQLFRTVLDLQPGYGYFSTAHSTTEGRLLGYTTRTAWRGQLRDASPYIAVVDGENGTLMRTVDPGRLQGADWTLYPITRVDGLVPTRHLAVSGVRTPYPVAHRVSSLASVDLDTGAIGGDRMLLRTTLPDYSRSSGWARIDRHTYLNDGSVLLVGVRYDALGVPRRAAARVDVAPVPSANIRVQFPGGTLSTVGNTYTMDAVITNTGPVRVDGVRLWSSPPNENGGLLEIVGCSLGGVGTCPVAGPWHGATVSLDAQASMSLRVRYRCMACAHGMPRTRRAAEVSVTTPFSIAETDRADHLGRQPVTFGPFVSGFE